MKYQIVFRQSVKKDIRRIPGVVLARLQEALRGLQENPFPHDCKKLRGAESVYRIRVGNYRIVYEVTSTIRIITVIRIGHRKNVYQ